MSEPLASLTSDEVAALRALLSDSELYVDDGQGGWIDPQTETEVLAPLRERLAALGIPEAGMAEAVPCEPRTFLLHLNIEMPHDSTASVHDLEAEVLGALDVGTDADMTPYLAEAVEIVIPLAEEV
jgi:hypothetical protein